MSVSRKYSYLKKYRKFNCDIEILRQYTDKQFQTEQVREIQVPGCASKIYLSAMFALTLTTRPWLAIVFWTFDRV